MAYPPAPRLDDDPARYAWCPVCRTRELDLTPGDDCPECGATLKAAPHWTTSVAPLWRELADWVVSGAATLRLMAESAWGAELLVTLTAVSLAVTVSGATGVPVAGAVAGGAVVGLVLSSGARFYALVSAGLMLLSLTAVGPVVWLLVPLVWLAATIGTGALVQHALR
jgi:hypothetical protein